MERYVIKPLTRNPQLGCAPQERDLGDHLRRGAVLLDKPAGPTSRGCVERVCGLLGLRKGGHGGTLDPKVTGVLPILLEDATPLCELFLGSDKVYEGSLQLHGEVTAEQLEEALEEFRGVIVQVPPVRSSVKRQARERRVHELDLTGREGRRVDFRVRCEGGTYIRKLAHDLGQRLGCGAHMTRLRRLAAGEFVLEECITLRELEAAAAAAGRGRTDALRRMVRSGEEVVARLLPLVWADDGAVHSLCTGYPLAVPGVSALEDFPSGTRVAVLTGKGELIGLGRAEMDAREVLSATRGIVVRMERVLMEKEAYPKYL